MAEDRGNWMLGGVALKLWPLDGGPELAMCDAEKLAGAILVEADLQGAPVRPAARAMLREVLARDIAIAAGATIDASLALASPIRGRDPSQAAEAFMQRWMSRRPLGSRAAALMYAFSPEIIADRFSGGRQALGFGASDFPLIFNDAMNLLLLDAFESSPPTWPAWGVETMVDRWQDVDMTWLDPFGGLPEVEPGSAFLEVPGISEAGATFRLAQYGGKWSLERRVILRGAERALQAGKRIGQACSVTEDDRVYALLAGNPLMSDGVALFDAAHGNQVAAALTTLSLDSARGLLAVQTTAKGIPLNLKAKTLLVPVGMATLAAQMLEVTANDQLGPEDKLELIIEPRLDRLDDAAWYLIADKSKYPVLSMAFLGGERQPQVSFKEFFDTTSMAWKCVHTFGAGLLDWRGIVRGKP